MKLTTPIVAEGGFACIFLHSDPSKVVKVFRRHEFTHDPIALPSDNEAISRAICHAEISAYRLLQRDTDLQAYAPQFFGQITIEEISKTTGESVLHEYIPDCAYVMEYLRGHDQKLAMLEPEIVDKVAQIRQRFQVIGIQYTIDASCFPTCTPIKLIDFGTWDAHGQLSEALAFQGQLSPRVRERWSGPLK